MKKLFYSAYIAPVFDFGGIIWSQCARQKLNRIAQIQKRTAKLILWKPSQFPSEKLFQTLNWLSFENRCKYHIGLLVYKPVHSTAPKYITNLLELSKNKFYNLRSTTRSDIKHIVDRTNLIKKTFSYTGMNVRNNIPIYIKSASNLSMFKRKLKTYMVENNYT